jgi:hypothetical protein
MKKALLKLVALGILLGGLAAAAPETLIVAEKSPGGAIRLMFEPVGGDPTPRVVICKGDGC